MRQGHLFLRVYPDLYSNYGYACGLFYGDLFLNIPAFLTLCGVNLLTSYKIFLVLIIAGTAGAAYYAGYHLFESRTTGLVSAFLYTFSSYFIFDLYLRAVLGEAQAWVFFPLIILGIYRLLWGEYQKMCIRDRPCATPITTYMGTMLILVQMPMAASASAP